jgi:hypothetical protein
MLESQLCIHVKYPIVDFSRLPSLLVLALVPCLLPFNYLGFLIFQGRPKVAYFQPIAYKIKAKLAAWKASLLSIVESS